MIITDLCVFFLVIFVAFCTVQLLATLKVIWDTRSKTKRCKDCKWHNKNIFKCCDCVLSDDNGSVSFIGIINYENNYSRKRWKIGRPK